MTPSDQEGRKQMRKEKGGVREEDREMKRGVVTGKKKGGRREGEEEKVEVV